MMINLNRSLWAVLICAAALIGAGTVHADRDDDDRRGSSWVATWAAASSVPSAFDGPTPIFNDTTIRQIVRVSVGGRQLRVWLTNEFGNQPLNIAEARVALRDTGSAILPDTDRRLTFGGESSIAIEPGARVLSDPVRLRVPKLSDVVISAHIADDLSTSGSPVTYHVRALQTNYLAPGNQTAAADLSNADSITSWFFLAAVDVKAHRSIPVVAAYGDSVTDGDQVASMEPVDLNARYTNFLAELASRGKHRAAVVNLGISGNQVTRTFIGENALARLDRDVLTQTGVTHLIFLEGINDIGLPGLLTAIGIVTPPVSAERIIAGHQQVVARARARGLIVVGGTLPPSGGSLLPGYSGAEVESKRQEVNHWIRHSGAYDIVVDFDKVLRDPSDHTKMLAELSADGLHPNSYGYKAMAKVAFAAIFRKPRND